MCYFFPLATELREEHAGILYTILEPVSADWHKIGIKLKFSPGDLDNIRAAPKHYDRAPMSWMYQLLVEYTRKTRANLEDLCEAVSAVHEKLATTLPKEFHAKGELCTSNYNMSWRHQVCSPGVSFPLTLVVCMLK